MSILRTFTNLTKAAVAVAVSPVAVVADVLTLPSTAIDGKPAFGKTTTMLRGAGDCMREAIKPESEKP